MRGRRTGRGSSAKTTGASTRLRWSNRCSTLMPFSTAHGGRASHQTRSGQQLSPAAGNGRRPVEDKLPVAAGPVRMERGAVRSLLMRVTNQALTVGLDFPGGSQTSCKRCPAGRHPRSCSQSWSWARPALASQGSPCQCRTLRRSTGGSLGPLSRWAGARLCIRTIAWCTRLRWSSTCLTLKRCLRSSFAGSSKPRAPNASWGCRSSAS